MTPPISIVTPVLNMAKHIAGCLESVQAQSVEVEHIIVDGGSTDGTLEIIKQYGHHNLTVISERDTGQSDAINKGLSRATGEVFNWLNADDRLEENALAKVIEKMSEGPSVVLGKCRHVETKSGPDDVIGQTYLASSISSTLANYSMAQPSHFYKSEVIKSLGGLNPELHYVMDMDLWFRYLLRFGDSKVRQLDSVISQFWLHPDAKSSAKKEEMAMEKYAVFDSILKSIGAPKVIVDLASKKAAASTLTYDCGLIDNAEFSSEFSWHLLLEAYELGNLDSAKQLLDIVLLGNRLSTTDSAIWKLRVAGSSGRLVKKLRGR